VTLTSAGLVFQLFSPSLEAGAMSNPWKFILGMPVGFAALALAGRRSGRRCVGRVLLVSGILTGISLVTGARSLALFFAMTALIVYTQDGRGRAARRIAVTLTCLLTVLVTTLIPVNDLPSSTVEKFQQQASVNPNPLLAGRTEVPLSLTVVSDHPLWGVGDTAQPYGGLVSKAEITARSMGYADPHALVPWWVLRNQIISHSVIFDMWIRWGVLGALPFLAAFLLIAWNTWKGRHAIRAADASLLFVTLLSAWDLLFSPAGSGRAAVIGYALAYALALRRLPSVHPAQREVMVKAATSRGTV
jgi:O-antigen ligase